MARHRGREVALRVLFEHDLAHAEPQGLLDHALVDETAMNQEFARALVEGVVEHSEELDDRIGKAAIDWKLSRMPTIDRNILRLATYEMLYARDVPISVIISEALELAQDYSTIDAKKFVNGVLSTLAHEMRPEGDQDRHTT